MARLGVPVGGEGEKVVCSEAQPLRPSLIAALSSKIEGIALAA